MFIFKIAIVISMSVVCTKIVMKFVIKAVKYY